MAGKCKTQKCYAKGNAEWYNDCMKELAHESRNHDDDRYS